MSEWGIEQHSTFGDAAGCFVEGLSVAGAIAIVVVLVSIDRNQDKPKDKTQPKIETVKQDSTVSLPDTIAFNATAYQR